MEEKATASAAAAEVAMKEEGAAASAATAEAPPGSIREGKAEVLPVRREPVKSEPGKKDARAEVFYNPAQVFNRDLSILVLATFGRLRAPELRERQLKKEQRAASAKASGREPAKAAQAQPGLRVLEALAATGIRSIRYAKELGPGTRPADVGIREIIANDLDPTAVQHMRRNLEHNGVPPELVRTTCGDANGHMFARRAKGPGGNPDEAYDVIDLDPYGSCAPFLDAAMQSVVDGGLLCITSTDMPVLGGNNPEVCFSRYGGVALKAGYLHEMALRLVLHAAATTAARYGREVQPLMSCSIDFYVRVFVRVHDAPARVKHLASKTAVVHQCCQCESFAVQPLGEAEVNEKSTKFKPAKVVAMGAACPECGGSVKLGGPFYAGPLHDANFVEQCLEACEEEARADLPGVTSWKKIHGMIQAISEEEHGQPLFYRLPALSKCLKLPPVPSKQFRGTLMAQGYKVSQFHREAEAIKTDAPNAVVYDLMRLWAEENPKDKAPLPQLLKKEFTLKRPIEWTTLAEEECPKKMCRFLMNPQANWGPKPAAKGRVAAAAEAQPAAPVAETAAPAEGSAAAETVAGGGP